MAVTTEQKPGAFWFREAENEAHASCTAAVNRISQNQESQLQQLLTYWRMYADSPIAGFGAYQYAKGTTDSMPSMSLNVTKATADAIASKICKTEVRPFVLPRGGDYALQERGKGIQRFLDGWRYEQKIHKKATQSFTDAEIFGSGHVKVYAGYGKVNCERVFRDELRVDDGEAKYGNPRTLYHITTIDKYQLIDSLDELRDFDNDDERKALVYAIEGAQLTKEQEVYRDAGASSQLIQLVEAWHLPNPGTEEGGRRIMCVSSGTIIDEKWKRQRFPIASVNWDEPVRGFFGDGLCKALFALQMELNKMMQLVQESMHLGAGIKIFCERNSEIYTEQLTNATTQIIRYTNQPPQFVVTPILAAEIMPLIQYYEQKAYNLARISQLSASGQKPAGLDSGEAQRTFVDIESDGFASVGRRFEDFNVDICDLAIDSAKELAQTDPKFAVVYRDKRSISVVKWNEVSMERDEFALSVTPTSNMPATVAGRISTALDMVNLQAGITPEEIRRIIGLPDLETEDEMTFSSRNRLMKMLSDVASGNALEDAPDSLMDLNDAQKIATQFYNYAINNGVELSRCDTIRDLVHKIIELKQPPPAPPAPPGADPNQPPTGPAAPPGAPPGPGPMPGMEGPPPGAPLQ